MRFIIEIGRGLLYPINFNLQIGLAQAMFWLRSDAAMRDRQWRRRFGLYLRYRAKSWAWEIGPRQRSENQAPNRSENQ